MPSTSVYFVLPSAQRLDRRLLDVVGRIEIRLAGRQRDDVAPRSLELARLRRHRDGRGGLDAIQAVGDETHIVWPFEIVRLARAARTLSAGRGDFNTSRRCIPAPCGYRRENRRSCGSRCDRWATTAQPTRINQNNTPPSPQCVPTPATKRGDHPHITESVGRAAGVNQEGSLRCPMRDTWVDLADRGRCVDRADPVRDLRTCGRRL